MKPAKILIVLICIAAAQAASAQEKKVSPAKMTCADYVAVDELYRPALVYWVAGVDKLGIKETDTFVVDTAHPVGKPSRRRALRTRTPPSCRKSDP